MCCVSSLVCLFLRQIILSFQHVSKSRQIGLFISSALHLLKPHICTTAWIRSQFFSDGAKQHLFLIEKKPSPRGLTGCSLTFHNKFSSSSFLAAASMQDKTCPKKAETEFFKASCDTDGDFEAIQCMKGPETTKMCWCSLPNGQMIPRTVYSPLTGPTPDCASHISKWTFLPMYLERYQFPRDGFDFVTG